MRSAHTALATRTFVLLVALATGCGRGCGSTDARSDVRPYAGPVDRSDGATRLSSATRGFGTEATAFAPDGAWFAYLRITARTSRLELDASNDPSAQVEPRVMYLTDALEVRWRATTDGAPESRHALATADWRPRGNPRPLRATLAFAPDAPRFVVALSHAFVVVDPRTGGVVSTDAADETVGSVVWASRGEIAYVARTPAGVAFARRAVDEHGAVGPPRRVHVDPPTPDDASTASEPRDPPPVDWSPDGRTAVYYAPQGRVALDLVAGTVLAALATVDRVAFRGDGAQLVATGYAPGATMLLLDLRTGAQTDLTPALAALPCGAGSPQLETPAWVGDGHAVLFRCMADQHEPPAWTRSYVVEPAPWRVVWSAPEWLHAAPVAGWAIGERREAAGCEWRALDSGRAARLDGCGVGWIWSPDGRRVAEAAGDAMRVFAAPLPPGAHVATVPPP